MPKMGVRGDSRKGNEEREGRGDAVIRGLSSPETCDRGIHQEIYIRLKFNTNNRLGVQNGGRSNKDRVTNSSTKHEVSLASLCQIVFGD